LEAGEAILPDSEARRADEAIQAHPDHIMFDRAQAKVERAQQAEEVRNQLAKLEAEYNAASDLAQKSRLRNETRRLERELRGLES
jgi:hypothetical protein